MILFYHQCRREFNVLMRQKKNIVNISLFLLILLCIFPLTLKPDNQLLQEIAPGVLWITILITFVMSAERLFQDDFELGILEQWILSGVSLHTLSSAKIWTNWLINFISLIFLCPIFSLLYNFEFAKTSYIILLLLVSTPGLMFLTGLVAAFGVGLQQKSIVMSLILMPLTLPIIILGSGIFNQAMSGLFIKGQLAILIAISLFASGFIPYAIATVLRINASES